uniref:C-type lectin domain-containing protein n=1 Tax=Oreochromis niloticus TaxID=8128 RepID=I3KMK9_ORENI
SSGEAADSQHAKSNRRSKVTTERVALVVLCILLAAALIVIYRLCEFVRCCNLFKDDPCYKCEAGWELHGGKCYYFSNNKSSWNKSRDECRAKGGDLVKIDSREEQSFLERRLRDVMTRDEDKFWIGLTDSAAEGRWVWVDGSSLDQRFDWHNGEHPDGEDCARMGKERRVNCYNGISNSRQCY